MTRRLRWAAASAAAVGAAAIALAPAASAATTISASWHPYGNTNPITSSSSHWYCGATKTFVTNVAAQACLVRTPDTQSFQSAIIVRNNRSTGYSLLAGGDIKRASDGGSVYTSGCATSTVAAHSWSVCFSATKPGPFTAYVWGYVSSNDGGLVLPTSPQH